MKKTGLICLLLCLTLALQCAVLPAFASEAGREGETTEASEPSDATTTGDAYTIPEDVSGDASVSNGCHTIDGKTPLSSDPGLAETAKGAILYEMNTGTLLYAKNPDQKLYPASLTKIMTCLLALELGNLDEEVTVSEAAIADIDPDGSTANLVAGEVLTFRDLLYCLMVSSANDAGAVIAEHLAGSEESFCGLMNKKAEALGCTGTHFSNPHGLHDEQHYTTARDMAKIMLAALSYDEFNKIYSTATYTVPATNLSDARELHTTNFLIGNDLIDYYYDDRFIGGKTGFTTPAGRCLITTCEEEGSNFRFLTVILGAEAKLDEDGYTILRYGNFEETVDMVDFGFETFTTVEVCTRSQTVAQFEVSGGENSVAAEPASVCKAILPQDYRNEDITLKSEVLAGGLSAPIGVGDLVGTLRIWYQNVCIAQTDLLSLSVSKTDTMTSILSGGVITQEEDIKINAAVRTGVKIFLIVLGIVVILSIIVAVRNFLVDLKRRRRRRNRRRSR